MMNSSYDYKPASSYEDLVLLRESWRLSWVASETLARVSLSSILPKPSDSRLEKW